MSIEVVEREGWFARLGRAIFGVLFGLILLFGGAALQFWNEGRTLQQARLLDDGEAHTRSIDAAKVDPAYEQQLVHVQGAAAADGVLVDPVFDQPAEALALRRTVEMYQWKERRERKEDTSVGGSKTTTTTYHYDKAWSDDLIDSSKFRETEGHRNPDTLPFPSEVWRADTVRLGGFVLDQAVVKELDDWKPMAPIVDRLPENLAASLRAEGEYLISSAESTPKIGDIRVRFERIPGGDVSVVAEQRGSGLQVAQRELGELVLVERGKVGVAALYAKARTRNSILGWVLRLVGFVMMWIGFSLVFAPFSVAADLLPMFGSLSRFAFGIVSGVLAALFSFVAIASGWLFHRPWMIVLLIAAAIVLVPWLLRRLGKRASATATAMPPSPPPPPPPGVRAG